MRYLDFAAGNQTGQRVLPERIIMAIDASPSMDDTDWPPSRLAAAIDAVIALVMRKARSAPEDTVGILAYARNAWWMLKPVIVGEHTDQLCQAASQIETKGATNISAALDTAKDLLRAGGSGSWLSRLLGGTANAPQRGFTNRIVLLTDGHHNVGGDPVPVARFLKSTGVCIDCVGIGGDPSDVDEALLKSVASKRPDGTPRYAFIGDKSSLIEKFEQLAGRITR